ncbi:MAG TPA: histidine phosphotransferase family protein [Stellaceae bacterium]|nr:histidine phosphotransferase family protein [Stellaceae bacterium]
MSVQVDFPVLELLCGRLCHELVSPVGAIGNGVELLGEDDPEFVKEAVALIGQSARRAAQRLQFYRFAYGTAGTGAHAKIDGAALAAALLEGGKVQCAWAPETAGLPPAWQRLACNMVALAAETLPRGGAVSVRTVTAGGEGIEVAAEGDQVAAGDELRNVLDDAFAIAALSTRNVHAYYTARLAQHLGMRLALAHADPHRLVFTAGG